MERRFFNETKRALFWAALAAECAGETHVTGNRIAAALLRSDSVRDFCSRAQIESARVLDAVDDPQTLSFDECERRVRSELARDGVELGSQQHRARVQLRPIDPVVRGVLDLIIERHGHVGVSPLELLRDLIRADPSLAARLMPHGLDADAIHAAIEEES